ncbi:hypothetical protein [Prosthecobacter sp.]|uniref:hypothetical protein n=1 Tax=Prosthecobacter sp. TaxID=1965333 RepID=UPI00248760D4|nr:hypothetical protein [Prosthecobacter sp.]MDI1311138.1 hypothetical protein [Prosthecobacter sp.]
MNSAFIKKNWYFFTPAIIIIIPALMVMFYTLNHGYSVPDSINAVFHVGSTGTRYSMDFSERKFNMVRPGMDGRTVFNTIKNPMEGNNPGADIANWRYSLPASGAGYYHERTIVMEKDKNGIPRVKQRISRFHTAH